MELDKIYQIFDEDKRLNTTKANSIEFITTISFIDKYLHKNDKILDVGAGTGAYSLYYADQGYDVTAVEPVKQHLECLKSKITPEMKLTAMQGNVLDLSAFEDDAFDIVLCLGPFYHLKSDKERYKCINETKRVCKPSGKLLYAYISNDMVFVTETVLYNHNYLLSDNYDRSTFKVVDEPFTFLTVDSVKQIMDSTGMKRIAHFAADGLSELLAEKIDAFNDRQFEQWLRFHLYSCQKEELLGYSNHIVYVMEK